MTRIIPSQATDEWFESEESPALAMIGEVQRIRRRTMARPIPVVLLAAAITAAVTWRFATKKPLVEAEVVLALTEGSLSSHKTNIPVEELRDYVKSVLMPDKKLLEVIKRRDLYRLRHKLGDDFALEQLHDQLEVEIWKNLFIAYDEGAPGQKSARIGITVADTDPDLAYGIARDIAGVVIAAADEQRTKLADDVTHDVALKRERVTERLTALQQERARRMVALVEANRQGKPALAAAINLDLLEVDRQQKRVEEELAQAATSPDAIADRIAGAGLDMSVEIVEEKRPDRTEHSGLVLIMIVLVVGVGALLGSALLLGAFDSRVHDADDVARLGLPVLGHVPGFAGDHVGSLASRGVDRRRVPSFLRWRFLR
jgi:capsular polysaccharide biosynthesis protein